MTLTSNWRILTWWWMISVPNWKFLTSWSIRQIKKKLTYDRWFQVKLKILSSRWMTLMSNWKIKTCIISDLDMKLKNSDVIANDFVVKLKFLTSYLIISTSNRKLLTSRLMIETSMMWILDFDVNIIRHYDKIVYFDVKWRKTWPLLAHVFFSLTSRSHHDVKIYQIDVKTSTMTSIIFNLT